MQEPNKKILHFKKGDIIYEYGSLCDRENNSIFYIKEGAVCLTAENRNKENLMMVIENGEMFGLEEIFYSKHRFFNLVVLSNLTVEVWSFNDFILAINLSLDTARQAVIQLIKKLRMINSRQKSIDDKTQNCCELVEQNSSDTTLAAEEAAESIYNFAFYDREPESIQNLYCHIGMVLKKGDKLIEEDNTDNNTYLVISGELEIYHNFKGKKEILGLVGSGDFCGEMNLFHNYKRSATVEVKSEVCKVLNFTKDSFDMLFQLHPKWSIKLLKNLSKKIVCTIHNLYYK